MSELSFDEAVQHVTQHRGAAYAFVPDGEPPTGGQLYVLAYNDMIEDDPEEWPYSLWYSGGRFYSSSGEEDCNGPDDIPEEVRSLTFHVAAPTFERLHLDYELQVPLKTLQGIPLDQARNDDRLFAGYDDFQGMPLDKLRDDSGEG